MEEMISNIVKVLSHTILVHIYSYPHFAIEFFLACVICVIHCLLIIDVNRVYQRTNAKAAARLRMRQAPFQEIETCSFHTISRLQTQIFPQAIEATKMKRAFYSPSYAHRRLNRKISAGSNFGWVVSHGDSFFKTGFEDRLEHLLSVSPSEYVRKDKARKHKQEDLKSCIQSLTSVLEDVFVTDRVDIKNISKESIKRSIEMLRETFDNGFSRDTYALGEFAPNLQTMMGDTVTKKSLQNALHLHRKTDESDKIQDNYINTDDHDSTVVLAESSSEFLNDYFNDSNKQDLHGADFISVTC